MGASRVERGTTLQGEYVLLDCIGERTGLVFRAERRRDGAPLLVRVLPGLPRPDGERVLELVTRASRIRHPALAAVVAGGWNDDDVFVVEEYVEGRSLAQSNERGGIPPLARAVEHALQLCRALETAHRQGVAHDALCPRNVLVRSAADPGQPQLKLVGLGVPGFVRLRPPPLDVALYMAPEQLAPLRFARGSGATRAMNVYSLAALLYDLCTGGPPFAAGSVDELVEAHGSQPLMPPSRINPQIPTTLDGVLLRALSIDPAPRFADMRELIEALSGLRLSTGVSGVQPVVALPGPPSGGERATWHGGFEERPTSKVELPPLPPTVPPPPPIASEPPARQRTSAPPARASAPPPRAPGSRPPPARASAPSARDSNPPPTAAHPTTAVPPGLPRRSAPPVGAFSGAPPMSLPVRSDRRFPRWALAPVVLALVAVLWVVLRVEPAPERVRTVPLEPEPPRAVSARPLPRSATVAPARVEMPEPETLSAGSRASEPVPSSRAERRPIARAVRRIARPSSPPPSSEHADEAQPAPASSNEPFAAQLPDEEDSEAAPPSSAPLPQSSSPAHAVSAPAAPSAPVVAAPAPAAREPEPARPARARVSDLQVRGSLPSSLVEQGIARIVPRLNECYRKASAGRAGAPAVLQVAFELDELGRARSPKVRGGGQLPGLAACVGSAAGRIASRRAPDTGTVSASFQLEFAR